MCLLEQDDTENDLKIKFLTRYLQNSYISIHLKKYKMCRFGITHKKKVANKRFFRYCLDNILRLLIS